MTFDAEPSYLSAGDCRLADLIDLVNQKTDLAGVLGVRQVDEIADFVVFLLSDRSGVVTGSVIDWDQNVLGGL